MKYINNELLSFRINHARKAVCEDGKIILYGNGGNYGNRITMIRHNSRQTEITLIDIDIKIKAVYDGEKGYVAVTVGDRTIIVTDDFAGAEFETVCKAFDIDLFDTQGEN